MMNPDYEIRTPIYVIRCVYLARVAAKRGDRQAARRWQAKVDAWLERTRVAWRDVTFETS
jgi:hypothetical protein